MSSPASRPDADVYDIAAQEPAHGTDSGTGDVEAVATDEATAVDARADASRAGAEAKGEPNAEAAKAEAEADKAKPKPARSIRPRRSGRLVVWRWDAPSWGVSLMVHAGILIALALVVVGGQAQEILGEIDAAMVDTSIAEQQAEELMTVLEDPSDAERELAVGDPYSLNAGGAPQATPNIRAETAKVSESRSLKGRIDIAAPAPSVAMLPSLASNRLDLSGGNKIKGDVGRETSGYDEALDQLAREILAHLANHRVTVLWMFDESGSMADDQRTVADKFDRVVNELKIRVPSERREAGDLEHAIIGFGQTIHFESSKPRFDLEQIRRAIRELPVDESGKEQTMEAVGTAVERYNRVVAKDRKVLLVLVSDESGDDGDLVERARLALVNRGVTVYVLGRQSMFGYDRVHLRYQDPVTGDVYWPTIKRGPETAGFQQLQYDGLHRERWDEQPSGFAPFELARLVEETGGIYFLLPNEEELRNRPAGEKAYSMATLKEYMPDYGPRADYLKAVASSPFRRSLVEVIELTDDFGFRIHYSANPPELAQQLAEELPRVTLELNALIKVEENLRKLEPGRNTEADRRWQANYDLMLAMVVAFQVKAYEYRACLQEMVKLGNQNKLIPKNPPIPGKRHTDWVLYHSRDKKAPPKETEKKYAEAERLLKLVIERHPDTPWADLAQTTLDRGLGIHWHERNVDPRYDERAKLVPSY